MKTVCALMVIAFFAGQLSAWAMRYEVAIRRERGSVVIEVHRPNGGVAFVIGGAK